MKTFEELGVCDELLLGIAEMGFVTPMPVQAGNHFCARGLHRFYRWLYRTLARARHQPW